MRPKDIAPKKLWDCKEKEMHGEGGSREWFLDWTT
jgi:hypothetical protein